MDAGGRLVYIPPSLALGGRAAPSMVLTIRRSGRDRRTLFTLPFEEYRGIWATELDWQPRPTGTPTDGGFVSANA